MENTMQQEIIIRGCELLRMVAEGRSTSSVYFWNITHAMEYLRDGDPNGARISLMSAQDMEPIAK
jgi:hypothetical protein